MELEKAVSEYSDYIYHIAIMYTKDRFAAEEIVQDTFLKFYQSNFEQRASVKTYLTRIAIHCSYDYLRKWSVKYQQFVDSMKGQVSDAEQYLVASNERQQVAAAILTLPVKYREVLFLYYYEELKLDDIANLLRIPASTARTRLQRAREKLKPQLQSVEWEVLRHE